MAHEVRPSSSPNAEPRSEEGEAQLLREILYTITRQRWVVVGVTLAVLGATALYTWKREPLYQSEATMRVSLGDAGSDPLQAISSLSRPGYGEMETEMLFLRSRQMAVSVADSLDLNVVLIEPQWPRSEVLETLDVPADAPEGTFELTRRDGGAYAVKALTYNGDGLPEQVEPGVPFRLGSATLALSPELVRQAPGKIVFSLRSLTAAAGKMRGSMQVYRPDANALVIGVRYESEDPEHAAAVPNEVASQFIQYKSLANRSAASSTVRFLRDQVSSYETELRSAEDRLRAFREEEQVVNLTDEATQQVRRLADLQASYDQLRSQRDALAGLLARVSQGTHAPGEASPYRQLASFPVFLQNPSVTNILQSLNELENERTRLLVRRTGENSDVRVLDQRIRELELQLYRTATNYLESLDSQIRSARSSLERFGQQLETIPAREVQYARFSREQELLSSLYTLLQTRLKEAEIREASEPAQVEVIDSALVPRNPFAPKPLQNMVLGGVLGLMMGVGVALARRAMDTKVRSREDVTGATGGAAILAAIPRLRPQAAPAAAGAGPNGVANGKRGRKIIPIGPEEILLGTRLVAKLDPRSPASEAYRALRTNITFASAERTPQVMVVTSAVPGDGKSTSASNLAITLAQQGTRTLLVDADLRRGVLHEIFDVAQNPGLTHLLMGKASHDAAVHACNVSEDGGVLDVLPAGVFPPNPAELLGSARMRQLMAELRERYEAIVIDAPPLNLVTDAAVLGTIADTTMLVARSGKTDRRALQHAVMQLRQVGATFGGVILNDVDGGSGSYYGYGYGYGYGAYAAAGK